MMNLAGGVVIQQLQHLQLDSNIRLLVVHPNYLQQHLLLSEFFKNRNDKLVYVRFDGSGLTGSQLKAQLDDALHVQVARLEEVDSLLLDECDRVESAAFESFLPRVVAELGRRVVVVSRHVPQCVFLDSDLRRYTRFVPTDPGLMLWDYAQRDTNTMLLEVRSFGTGRVLLNGQPVDNWDGMLPRSLFFYLVDRGMTTRNDIFATFWPNLSTREATNVFHVTKRKISEVLGTDLTVYWSGFYRIAPTIELSYDAVQFSEMVQSSAIATLEDSGGLLERAISLYRGSFLNTLNAEWVLKRREELLQTYADALVSLARFKEKAEQRPDALGLYTRAALINPHREDLAASIMRLYQQMGLYTDAIRTYERLESELGATLGVAPTAKLKEMAAAIRAEMN